MDALEKGERVRIGFPALALTLFLSTFLPAGTLSLATAQVAPLVIAGIPANELVGSKWTGSWNSRGGRGAAEFTVTAIEGNNLRGTMLDHGTSRGTQTHSLSGSVEGDKITFRQGRFEMTLTMSRDGTALILAGPYTFAGTPGSYWLRRSS